MELLYGIEIKKDKLIFIVNSNGCTDKDSFELKKVQNNQNWEIELIRIKEDNCKRMPFPLRIEYSESEFNSNGMEIIINNKFSYLPFVKH